MNGNNDSEDEGSKQIIYIFNIAIYFLIPSANCHGYCRKIFNLLGFSFYNTTTNVIRSFL